MIPLGYLDTGFSLDSPTPIATGTDLTTCCATCKSMSNTIYSAMQNGSDCYCTNNYNVNIPATSCTVPCSDVMTPPSCVEDQTASPFVSPN